MDDAAKTLDKYIQEETALEFWACKVVDLFYGEAVGRCVVRRVSNTELAFLKPDGKTMTFRSVEGFIVEPHGTAHINDGYQLHIRTSMLTDWINLKPLTH